MSSRYQKTDPKFAEKVRRGFYVDDFCSGATNTEKGYVIYKKVKLRFAEAKFNVRKWVSNDTKLTELINRDESIKSVKEEIDKPKVLGITWDCDKDTLSLGMKQIFDKAAVLLPTKRNILKSIASIFDPCGYLQNITINLKPQI